MLIHTCKTGDRDSYPGDSSDNSHSHSEPSVGDNPRGQAAILLAAALSVVTQGQF